MLGEQTEEMALANPEFGSKYPDRAPLPSNAPRAISRNPRATVVRVPFHAGENGAVSGRQRRHGRKPAASAAAAEG